MPLFVCDACGTIENTGAANYWGRNITGLWSDPNLAGKALCSVCTPDTFADGRPNKRGGVWHNRFAREIATEELILKIGIRSFVYLGRFSYLEESRE